MTLVCRGSPSSETRQVKTGKRTFIVLAPQLWNPLPREALAPVDAVSVPGEGSQALRLVGVAPVNLFTAAVLLYG